MPDPVIPLEQMVQQNQPKREKVRLRPITPTKARKQTLADINLRIVRVWEDAEEDIVDAYRRARAVQADAMVRDDVEWLEAAIDAVAGYVASQMVILQQFTLGWAQGTNVWHLGQFTGRVSGATGIDLALMMPPMTKGATEAVRTTTAWNVSLIKDVSAEIERRVSGAVLTGMREGQPIDVVADQISRATGIGRRRAIRIAVDQTNKLSAALDTARMREMGFTHFVWVHRSIQNPRLWHLARDGEVFELDDPQLVGDMPGDLPFCRCVKAALMVL